MGKGANHQRLGTDACAPALAAMLLVLLVAGDPRRAAAHFCGDGETNQAVEECDPRDDAACPGLCSSLCECAVCGDGVLAQPVEQCDQGDDFACPGNCQPTCLCPTCGNGVAEFPETCDGPDDTDCPGLCSAECRCPSPCGAIPDAAAVCRQPGAGLLVIKNVEQNSGDRLRWKWAKGAQTSPSDFLDPVSNPAASYGICLYDGALQPLVDARVYPASNCEGGPCWLPHGSGYAYKDPAAAADGITTVKLKAGASGAAQVQVRARGPGLNTPRPQLRLPVVVQLIAEQGASRHCWQSTFDGARINEPGRFSAKLP
jgi:hypothetical protein